MPKSATNKRYTDSSALHKSFRIYWEANQNETIP